MVQRINFNQNNDLWWHVDILHCEKKPGLSFTASGPNGRLVNKMWVDIKILKFSTDLTIQIFTSFNIVTMLLLQYQLVLYGVGKSLLSNSAYTN